MNGNTPDQITDRSKGATFYCSDCRQIYQKCQCKVYRSADSIRQGKSGVPRRGTGHRSI